MKQFIIQNKTFLMFVFLLLVIIIFFATKKPKIVTYKSDNKVLEQIQAEQQKQIDYLRFKIDSLNKELIIKKKLDAELQSKSENEIFKYIQLELEQQVLIYYRLFK